MDEPREIEVETLPCRFCGAVSVLLVDGIGFRLWLNGELIQNALPDLSADERELLMTGTCSRCF